MGHDGVVSGCQRDPWERGVTIYVVDKHQQNILDLYGD